MRSCFQKGRVSQSRSSRLSLVCDRISMKASAESREKDEYSLIETWRAVKGARRAFILTLDGAPRPTESTWERSETNFSEASFPKGHDSVLSRSSCIIASTKARL
jgi:hypothetical protein